MFSWCINNADVNNVGDDDATADVTADHDDDDATGAYGNGGDGDLGENDDCGNKVDEDGECDHGEDDDDGTGDHCEDDDDGDQVDDDGDGDQDIVALSVTSLPLIWCSTTKCLNICAHKWS